MFCVKCGKAISEGGSFCAYCGSAAVTHTAIAPETEDIAANTDNSQTKTSSVQETGAREATAAIAFQGGSKKKYLPIAAVVIVIITAAIIFYSNIGGGSLGRHPLVGTWRTETGSITQFNQNGTGTTKDDAGIYEFTWETIRFDDALARFTEYWKEYREFMNHLESPPDGPPDGSFFNQDEINRLNRQIREYEEAVREFEQELDAKFGGISKFRGVMDHAISLYGDEGWGKDDYVVALTFNNISIPVAFLYTLENRNTLVINTGNMGRVFSPTTNVSQRFQWVTLTKSR